MTFACKNHEFDTDMCRKLKCDCIMGRRGCVLEGRVKLTEDMKKRVQELENLKKGSKSSFSGDSKKDKP